MLNFASRVLNLLFFQDLEKYFQEQFRQSACALSPLRGPVDNEPRPSAEYTLIIENPARKFHIRICCMNYTLDAVNAFSAYMKTTLNHLELVLSILFNYRYRAALHEGNCGERSEVNPGDGMLYMEIALPSEDNSGAELHIGFPTSFFRLFSPELTGHFSPETAEEKIVSFFRDPSHLFPGISMILETFSDSDLQKLLFQLQKRNLLTPYQICLVLLALPEKALRLKKNISRNTILEVSAMMRHFSGRGAIQNRDLTGGLYSIEEAVYFLIREGADFSYSTFLRNLQHILSTLSRVELLLLHSFREWLAGMEEDSLLYATLSSVPEIEIARSISDDTALYLPILRRYISARKVADISRLLEGRPVSFMEHISAQAAIIHQYRKLRAERRNLGDESFEYLLRRFSSPGEYRHLLFAVGWFPLSTALKGLPRARVKPVLEKLPRPARYLIEDVLKGIVNPNIIHGEMQIHSARRLCVRAITTLSEDGIIRLVE
jgi:hypothetical protein